MFDETRHMVKYILLNFSRKGPEIPGLCDRNRLQFLSICLSIVLIKSCDDKFYCFFLTMETIRFRHFEYRDDDHLFKSD